MMPAACDGSLVLRSCALLPSMHVLCEMSLAQRLSNLHKMQPILVSSLKFACWTTGKGAAYPKLGRTSKLSANTPRYLATSSSVVLDPCNPTNNLARTMNRFAWGLLEKATSETLQSLGEPSRLPGVPVVFTAATVVLVTVSRVPERGLASALAWQACSTPGRSRLQRVCRGVFGGCAAVGSFRIGGESRCDSVAGPYKQSACSPVHTCMHAPPCVCVHFFLLGTRVSPGTGVLCPCICPFGLHAPPPTPPPAGYASTRACFGTHVHPPA